MRIAAFQCADSAIAAREMAEVVARLVRDGVKIAGVIEERDPASAARSTTCTLRNVSTTEGNQIYLDTPRADTSCRINTSGVGAACVQVMEQIAHAELVVLSKFGKLEAAGDGLYPAIEAAVEAGKPVLTSVSRDYRKKWLALAPGAAIISDCEEALAWFAGLIADYPRPISHV